MPNRLIWPPLFSLHWGPTPSASRRTFLHFPVPVLRLLLRRSENLHVPLAAAPWFDDVANDNVDENLREGAALGIPLEVIRLFIPAKRRIEQHRQKEVEAVVDDDDLAAGTLLGGVVDEVFFGAVGADIPLED